MVGLESAEDFLYICFLDFLLLDLCFELIERLVTSHNQSIPDIRLGVLQSWNYIQTTCDRVPRHVQPAAQTRVLLGRLPPLLLQRLVRKVRALHLRGLWREQQQLQDIGGVRESMWGNIPMLTWQQYHTELLASERLFEVVPSLSTISPPDNELTKEITFLEITKEISRFKCGKASGVDDFPNDAIKSYLRIIWSF
ncbi:hypothetical protein LAZ67_19002213 [Cordylochernes scorpioides]|uniref:Maturase K n=1 Tax=Cordylochernes scorpioides TaxID=51811 RepID=A0ABY6LIM9_9ARAC|nr:hypothetical protein LAZ67_19002213 [Cordylochernes scorpioides]